MEILTYTCELRLDKSNNNFFILEEKISKLELILKHRIQLLSDLMYLLIYFQPAVCCSLCAGDQWPSQ